MTQMPTLADLVRQVILDSVAGPHDPVRQIGGAERLAGELSHLGESVVGYFVEQARAEGLSWSDIGAPRGLSRQGAQQRYAPFLSRLTVADLIEAGVLRQFGEAGMACLRRAEGHARRLRHDAIDAGDLLLALLDDEASPVVTVLRSLGADLAAVREELERSGDGRAAAQSRAVRPADVIAVGAEARRALDGAVAEARGHSVGARHILLGLLRNPASPAGRALGAYGITKAAAFGAVLAGDQLRDRA
jgi:hypothetical protein